MSKVNRIAVLTSGGDAPGMNAAIRAVVRAARSHQIEVLGVMDGYEGLLEGRFKPINTETVADIIQRGGTILKSSRSEVFPTDEGILRAVTMLNTFKVDGLVVIGGDGSLTGAKNLYKNGVRTMGLPGTIDTDLAYTDVTIGFDTSVNTVLDAISKVRDTSSSHGRVTVIEVMGRNCGDIALHAGVAGGAGYVLLPEVDVDVDLICQKLVAERNQGKLNTIIMIAEGANIKTNDLVEILETKTGIETRAVVLGYVQRGGSPTAGDRILASRLGNRAVELLVEGKSGRALGMQCNAVVDIDLEEALAMKNEVDEDLLNLARKLTRL